MDTPDISRLIGRQAPGHALQREFYTDPRIFDADMKKMLLRHWFCVAHHSDLPHAGDYLVVELGAESVIIAHNRNDEITALVNVCRHRGSRVCTAKSGRAAAGRFTCPYHAWTYDLNGHLIAAQQMPDGFDPGRHGLKVLPVRIVAGLIFTTFADEPLDFGGAEYALAQSARVHGWAQAKVAHRQMYSIQANWKLAIENYMECYHCQPAHPEFSRRHVYARPARQVEALEQAGRRRAEALGIVIPDIDQYGRAAARGSESVSVFRSALDEGVDSATPDSRPIGRLMGHFSRHDGNSTYFDIGPISDFLAYADHGVIYRFIPRSVMQTDMEVIWLVHEEAVVGRDYEVERLIWLWHVTSLEDKKIVETNQAGVNSQFYVPGPYSMQEPYPRRFVEWYLRELAEGGNDH
ncbi:MAG: aromatic ring-hydroxylating dioxygenase subunit alpha [Steroidobacterales bacterium]